MLIALTGLHAAGKSFFASNIPHKFGFEVINKKELVEYICKEETGSEDWLTWYRNEFNKDPFKMTYKIISYLPTDKDIILDAVHSYKEWKIIKSINSEAMLVVITTPEEIRSKRWEKDDNIKDIQRVKYWHSDYNGESGCLLAQASWSFNGAASLKTNEDSFRDLLKYIKKDKNIDFNTQEEILDKEKLLSTLLNQDKVLSYKLNQAKCLLEEYEKIQVNVNEER